MATERKKRHVFVIKSRGKKPRKAPSMFGGTTSPTSNETSVATQVQKRD